MFCGYELKFQKQAQDNRRPCSRTGPGEIDSLLPLNSKSGTAGEALELVDNADQSSDVSQKSFVKLGSSRCNLRCLRSANLIKNNSPRGIELLEQVKVPNIAGQHGTSVFSSGGE
jgi:hypothetical protein